MAKIVVKGGQVILIKNSKDLENAKDYEVL